MTVISIILIVVFLLLGLGAIIALSAKKKSKTTTIGVYQQNTLFNQLRSLFLGKDEVQLLLPQLEEVLLSADVGIKTTQTLIEKLVASNVKKGDEAISVLKSEIISSLQPAKPLELGLRKPTVIFFVGVNGVGKTTTMGKLASLWTKEGKKVLMVAADTFRAAAREQLEIWAGRAQCELVGGAANSDPASVVCDGVRAGVARGMDIVMIDTAGRLQNKSSLMEELKKMFRIAEKELGRPVDEAWLVLDANTGQNGFLQAKIFFEAVNLTGFILTKYDSTSKGGILLSVVKETGLPIRFVGVGEKVDDLKKFEPAEFVNELFN